MRRLWYLALIAGLSLATACGGDDDTEALPVDAGTPGGTGIVDDVAGTTAPDGGAAENGRLVVNVTHGGGTVNDKVTLSLYLASAPGDIVAESAGGKAIDLAPGIYKAKVRYTESATAKDLKGGLAGLKVNAAHKTAYEVELKAPIGRLDMAFSRAGGEDGQDVAIDDKVELTVFTGGADVDLDSPVWSGMAGSPLFFATGKYDVRAVYQEGNDAPITEWYRGIELGEGLATVTRKIIIETSYSGMLVEVFNFSTDVSDRSTVYFFNPGANVEYAVAKNSGDAGGVIAVDPGIYDIWVVYTPSPRNPNFRGSVTLKNFEIAPEGGARKQVDVQMKLAIVRVKVMDGEEDVSDGIEMRMFRAGADTVAGSPLLDEVGVGEHFLPTDAYDIYLTVKEGGSPVRHEFKNVELVNGAVWEQTFNVQETKWRAAPTKVPAAPLRPIDWVEPPAGDDDDSAKTGGAEGAEDSGAVEGSAEGAAEAEPAQSGDASQAGEAAPDAGSAAGQ